MGPSQPLQVHNKRKHFRPKFSLAVNIPDLNKNFTLTIDVSEAYDQLLQLLPARLVALSKDGLAGIIAHDKYWDPNGYRSVYFSFEVEAAEGEIAETLLVNAVEWTLSWQYKDITSLLGNLVRAPKDLATRFNDMFAGLPGTPITSEGLILNEEGHATMELTTNASGKFHVLVAYPTTDEVKAGVLRGPARIINITRVAEHLTSVTTEASAGTVTLGLGAGSQSALNPAYAAVKLEVTAAPAAEFETSNLMISPKEVWVGEEVTVSVNVKNIGGAKDTYTVVLKVNGVVEASKDVTLAAGESTVVTFKAKRNVAGTYRVEVDGLADSFMVKAPRPAEFRFAELSISPAIAKRGETITITVKVTNVGDEAGNYTVELRIAGAVVDPRTVTLAGGESTTVTFEVSEHVAGTYDVEVDGQKGTIIVEEAAPMPSPIGTWLPYIGAAVAIIATLAVAAFLARRRRIKASFGKAEVKESSS